MEGMSAEGKSQMFADLLQKFDTDSNGMLEDSEMDSMTQSGQEPTGAEILAEFDADGDGSISESENETIIETMPHLPPCRAAAN